MLAGRLVLFASLFLLFVLRNTLLALYQLVLPSAVLDLIIIVIYILVPFAVRDFRPASSCQ